MKRAMHGGMRQREVALIALIVIAWAILLAAALGCASPRAQLRTAVDAYATTLGVLTDARAAGLIDDAEAAEIETWRVLARQALDAWRAALDADADPGSAIQTFNEAMRALVATRLGTEEGPDDGDN
jgi:hypothetical protein